MYTPHIYIKFGQEPVFIFFFFENINLDIMSHIQSHLIKYRSKVFKNISAAGKG